MKTFEEYIREAVDFRLGGKANKGTQYNYSPKGVAELYDLTRKLMIERGNEGDFNDIDTSNVTNMAFMFEQEVNFNGNISQWDTSNVTIMRCMFHHAESFNQDISNWDVSKVIDNKDMFKDCQIKEEFKPKFNI